MNIQELLPKLENLNQATALLIPTVCDDCGVSLNLNRTMTELSCYNPYCKHKLVQRGLAMCDFLGIKDVGESFFKNYFEITEDTMLANFLGMEDSDYDNIVQQIEEYGYDNDVSVKTTLTALTRLYENVVKKRPSFTMSGYLRALALPHLQERADKICEGYDSFHALYEDLERCVTLEDYNTVLGLSAGSTKITVNICDTLSAYSREILFFEQFFPFYKPVESDLKLKIVCSTSVGHPYRTKKEFYDDIDSNFADLVTVTWTGSASKSCDVLIWSGADGSGGDLTSKVEKICKFNRTGSHIPILTGLQFKELLESAPNSKVVKDTLDSLELIDYTEY